MEGVRGATSEVSPAQAVRARDEALLSDVTVDAVADVGHAIASSRGEVVADRLNTFLGSHEPQGSRRPSAPAPATEGVELDDPPSLVLVGTRTSAAATASRRC